MSRTKKIYRKKNSTMVSKIKKVVQSEIHKQVENKQVTLGPIGLNPTSAAIVQYLLNGLSQGTDIINRVGDKARFIGIDMRFTLSPNLAVIQPTRVRVLIYWNAQTNGALAVAGELLQDAGPGTAIFSPLNLKYRQKYIILHDKVYNLTYGGDLPASRNLYEYRVFKKLTRVASYDGAAAAINQLQKNSLEMMILTDAPANAPSMNWSARVLFEDP